MKVLIAGTGLIGGSMALALRRLELASEIWGIESNPVHAVKAQEKQLVDRIVTWEEGPSWADLIVLAIPVDATEAILPHLLDNIQSQIVMDVGSIKQAIIDVATEHQKRGRFVATHPMWGTEYSGPEAATHEAFRGRAVVICDQANSDLDALKRVEGIYRALDMHLVYMDAAEHDRHVAYVSHISHVTSFALANTVLEKEKQEDAIFELASGGFASTVRLAKSSPEMWVPVLMQNKENVLEVLGEHVSQLQGFKRCLEQNDVEGLRSLILHANRIKRILT